MTNTTLSEPGDEARASASGAERPGTPSLPDGPPDGPDVGHSAPTAPTAAQLLASLPSAPPAAPDAPAAPTAGERAALVGEPDAATDLRWCRKCSAMVRPIGKGRCERCNAFLKLNFTARRHPINVLRRDALLAELVAEYQPTTTMQRSTCAHLAGTLEQLEVMKPGSTDWQRLVQVAQTLGASLDATRDVRPQTPDALDTLSDQELHERLEALYLDSAARVEAQRRSAEIVSQASAALRGEPALDIAADAPQPISDTPSPASNTPAPQREQPTPACQYCRRAPGACETLKADRLDLWRAVHALRPDEVERRRAEATAVMMRPGASRMPDWY